MILVTLLASLVLGGVSTPEPPPSGDSLVLGLQERQTRTQAEIAAPDEDILPLPQALALVGLLAGGGGFAWWLKRRQGVRRVTGAVGTDLHIVETRSLGGRQFLVVVEHDEERSLLGVGPGFVNFLRALPRKKESTQVPVSTESASPPPPARKSFAVMLAGKDAER